MVDFMVEYGGFVLGGMVVMWLAQFWMAYRQMKVFYKDLALLRKDGLTAVGLNGDRLKGRAYGILVIDDQDRVVHAQKFAGWTVFARLQPAPELVGMSLSDILDDGAVLPVSAKLRPAFVNAARDLQAARQRQQAPTGLQPA